MNMQYCLIFSVIGTMYNLHETSASPFPRLCSHCLEGDRKCASLCSYLEPEVNLYESRSQDIAKRDRFQHQLRFGKRSWYGITSEDALSEESFTPQLRFGKRSTRTFMSHIRFGKRGNEGHLQTKSFSPQGRFGRAVHVDVPYIKSDENTVDTIETPTVLEEQAYEKRFRPQGRFGKRMGPNLNIDILKEIFYPVSKPGLSTDDEGLEEGQFS